MKKPYLGLILLLALLLGTGCNVLSNSKESLSVSGVVLQ